MENLNVAEVNFYQSKAYRNVLIGCGITLLFYLCFIFIVYHRLDGKAMFLLILGLIVNLASWDNPIVTISDTIFIFRNGIYRKKILLADVKSVETKGDSLFWNMKTILVYREGNKDKKFIIWASMIEDYQNFLNFLNKKVNKPNTIYPAASVPESVI